MSEGPGYGPPPSGGTDTSPSGDVFASGGAATSAYPPVPAAVVAHPPVPAGVDAHPPASHPYPVSPHPYPGAYPGGFPPPPAPARPGRGLWIGLGTVALVLTVLVGAVVGVVLGRQEDQTNSAAASAATNNGKVVTITPEDTRELMASQTKALTGRDEKAFLRPLDPARKPLVAAQTRLFRNLTKLPLTGLRFETIQQLGRATDSFGRGVTIELDVALVHQFEGVDVRPTAEWYRWTVTRANKDAPLVITAIGGAPAAYGSSSTVFYPGPWDKWADIHIERTEHVIVLTEPALAASAKKYAAVAEQAVRFDTGIWQRSGPAQGEIPKGFVVSLVRGKKAMGSLYRTSTEKVTEAGVSIAMPSFRGASDQVRYGASRVVVDLDSGFFTGQIRNGAQDIFRHELAHSMVATLNSGKQFDLQNWLVEGFAEYMAGHDDTGPDLRLGDARHTIGRFDGRLPDNFSWGGSGRISFHYWLGHQALRYAATRYGEKAALDLVYRHYQGSSVEKAVSEALGVRYAEFEQGVAAYARSQVKG